MLIKRTVVKKHEAPALTIKAISSALHRETDYWIAGEAGLFIRIYARRTDGKPSAKTYYHVWAEKGSANKNRIKLGSHIENDKHRTKSGQLTLSQAVKRNQEIISLLDRGIDPRSSFTSAAADSIPPTTADEDKCWANMTVNDLSKKYLAFVEDPTNRASKTFEVYNQLINKYVLPAWGPLMLADIKRSDARKLILDIKNTLKKYPSFENEKITGAARQVLKVCRTMFNFQIEDEDEMPANPFSKIDRHQEIAPIMVTKKKERALRNGEIKQLWQLLASADGWGSNASRRALLLCLVTGQRPGEVTGMHHREIDGDWWQIPASRIKTRSKRNFDHRVYLTPLAKRIINDREGFIFESTAHSCAGQPINEDTLNQLVNKETVKKDANGKTIKTTQPEWLGLKVAWTPHDLRKTASTGLASIGCPQDYIDKILNHQLTGARARYNLCEYDPQKQEWATKWSAHLEKVAGVSTFQIHQTELAYDIEELRNMVSRYPLSKVGEQLGISGNAVKKRCIKHGIDFPEQGYWLKSENRFTMPREQKPITPDDSHSEEFTVRRIIRRPR